MNNNQLNTKEITTIGVGIAALIAGGAVIYQMSTVFPIPGFKYMMMAPYLSMVIYILLVKIGRRSALLYIGTVFALVMVVMNMFMSLSIIITTLLSHVTSSLVTDPYKRAFVSAIFFSGYTGSVALLVSKYLIGGVFMEMSILWIISVGIMCLAFASFGVVLARKMMVQLSMYNYN